MCMSNTYPWGSVADPTFLVDRDPDPIVQLVYGTGTYYARVKSLVISCPYVITVGAGVVFSFSLRSYYKDF
jgi:hypothetical protein